MFCVVLQLNQSLCPADTQHGELCWHSRGVASKARRGRTRRKNQQLGTGQGGKQQYQMPASPPNTSSHETTVSDKDTKHSFKSDISHVLSNSSVACKAGPHQSSSLCGQCCFYKLQLRATAIPGHCGFGSSADSFCDPGACWPASLWFLSYAQIWLRTFVYSQQQNIPGLEGTSWVAISTRFCPSLH